VIQTRSPALHAAAVALVVFGAAGCDVRRDAAGTLARVQGGTIRVGVVENRPWTTLPTGGGGGGIEGALVAELARDLGAKIEWSRAPESQLLEALELRELDVVIGGLTDANPWKERVAFTRPFYTDTIVVGAPAGIAPPRDLSGHTVAVRAGDPVTAAYVRRRAGIPRVMAELGQAPGLVAAPTWQMPSLALGSIGITLREVRHVVAAPRGERAWVRQIEQSLAKRTPVIGEVLRTSRP
jgi:polar amino acid transport system substrate-binding protein